MLGRVGEALPHLGGIVLTGGASRRMGLDKTVLPVEGFGCAERVARVLRCVVDPVVEVGPGVTTLPAVREDPPGTGPLAATCAGFARLCSMAGTALSVVLAAGDLPFLSDAAVRMLADWPTAGSVVPVVEGRPQPLCARWSASALAEAGRALARGERSMHPLLSWRDVEFVDESGWPGTVDVLAFSDIDTRADLERLGLETEP
jgi:molybdopterin-guanine dinucleotide biosynthesis protein A